MCFSIQHVNAHLDIAFYSLIEASDILKTKI